MTLRDRFLFGLLLLIDRLFGTRWTQRVLARRHARLAEYQRRMSGIQSEIGQLEVHLDALHVQLCLLYLRQRHLMGLEDWLRFESGGDDEPGLDLLIEHLVKPRLAAVEMHETAPGHQVYHLRPDWRAVAAALGDSAMLEPETLAWLHRQIAAQTESTA
jgi:hypothetical protein